MARVDTVAWAVVATLVDDSGTEVVVSPEVVVSLGEGSVEVSVGAVLSVVASGSDDCTVDCAARSTAGASSPEAETWWTTGIEPAATRAAAATAIAGRVSFTGLNSLS